MAPDILVEQRDPVEETLTEDRFTRSEADLRGALRNTTLTEDEQRLRDEEQAIAEETARLRNQDYQLAYAIDFLTGLHALGPNAR